MALRLPLYLDHAATGGERERFMQAPASLNSGIRLVQLRLFDLSEDDLVRIGREACALCPRIMPACCSTAT